MDALELRLRFARAKIYRAIFSSVDPEFQFFDECLNEAYGMGVNAYFDNERDPPGIFDGESLMFHWLQGFDDGIDWETKS